MHTTDSSKRHDAMAPVEHTRAATRAVFFTAFIILLIGAAHALFLRSENPDIYRLHIFFHQYILHEVPGTLVAAGLLCLAYLVRIRLDILESFTEALYRKRRIVALLFTVAMAVGSLVIYHNHPLTLDEFSMNFQARVFAMGRLQGQMPPPVLDFAIPGLGQFFFANHQTGAVISGYWPGFALLLAPFHFLGAPWLLNPILGGLGLLLMARLAVKVTGDEKAGGWAMLLALATPTFVAVSLSYYSMNAHMVFNLAYALLLCTPTRRRLFLAGLVGGFALALHNPFPHFLFSLPFICWLAFRPGRWTNLAILAAGYVPLTLLLCGGWVYLKGLTVHGAASSALLDGGIVALLNKLSGGAFALPDATILLYRFMGFVKINAWAVPGLVVIAGYGAWLFRRNSFVLVLAAAAATTFGGYLFVVFNQGHGWGYRHFHPALGMLPVLAAAAVWRVGKGDGEEAKRFVRMVGTLCILSLVLFNGFRLYQVESFMARHLSQLPPLEQDVRQLCFIRVNQGYYTLDLVQNDPFLRGNVIYLMSDGPDFEYALTQRYASDARQRGLYEGDTVWLLDDGGVQQ